MGAMPLARLPEGETMSTSDRRRVGVAGVRFSLGQDILS